MPNEPKPLSRAGLLSLTVARLLAAFILVGCMLFLPAGTVRFWEAWLYIGLLFIPAAIGNYAATGEVGAGFRFGEIFGLVKAAPAAYLMVLVGGFLAAMITFVGLVACIIGVFLTAAYASAINAHLMGQAYYEARLILDGKSDDLEQVAKGKT